MARIRRHVSWVVALWLICQVAMIAAAPFAGCGDHAHAQASMPADCDMHHHQAGAEGDGASLRCQCQVQDAALASLILGTGLLPPEVVLADDTLARPSIDGDISSPSRSDAPDTHPPRG